MKRAPRLAWDEEDIDLMTFLRVDLLLPIWAIGALLGRSAFAVKSKLEKTDCTICDPVVAGRKLRGRGRTTHASQDTA